MTGTPAPSPTAARGSRVGLAWGTTITGAFVVTLLRPLSWALGLLGFLAGGGIVLVAVPILVLPTPTGLQNALGGPVSSLVFGAPSTGLVALIAGGIAGAFALVGVATLTGAWAERQGIAVVLEAAADDGLELPATDLDGAPGFWRVAVVRLLALAPIALAAGLAWRPLYDATYRELTLPRDLGTPLPVRVLGAVPWPILGVAIAWVLADAAAAVGVRRLVLERRPVMVAWLIGWADLVRRPHRIVPTALAGTAILLLLVAPAMLAASIGWARVRDIIGESRDPVIVAVAVGIWVAIWLAGLVLAGVGAAIRAALWTLELPRIVPSVAGAEQAVPASDEEGATDPAREPAPRRSVAGPGSPSPG